MEIRISACRESSQHLRGRGEDLPGAFLQGQGCPCGSERHLAGEQRVAAASRPAAPRAGARLGPGAGAPHVPRRRAGAERAPRAARRRAGARPAGGDPPRRRLPALRRSVRDAAHRPSRRRCRGRPRTAAASACSSVASALNGMNSRSTVIRYSPARSATSASLAATTERSGSSPVTTRRVAPRAAPASSIGRWARTSVARSRAISSIWRMPTPVSRTRANVLRSSGLPGASG